MWIVAGPNGAGKSTFVKTLIAEPDFEDLITLNADEVTAELAKIKRVGPRPTNLNLQAARQIDAKVEELIELGDSFLVETVLSSDKYRDDVLRAKQLGYKIGLFYISLHPPALSPLRVSERVQKGGHSVQPLKALARYGRSHAQLTWFADQADYLRVYDNSADDGKPVCIAVREEETEHVAILKPGAVPAVDAALASLTGPKPRAPRRLHKKTR